MDKSARRIYVNTYILLVIFVFKVQKFRDDNICQFIGYRTANKDYPLFQEPAINIVCSFSTWIAFNNHRYKFHRFWDYNLLRFQVAGCNLADYNKKLIVDQGERCPSRAGY